MFNKYMVMTALLGTCLMATTVQAMDDENRDNLNVLPVPAPRDTNTQADWRDRDRLLNQRSIEYWQKKSRKHPKEFRVVDGVLQVYG